MNGPGVEEGNVANILLDKPRYLSVLYPALMISSHGFNRGVNYFRAIMGGSYNVFLEKIIDKDLDNTELEYWLKILDTYIRDPSYRRMFIHFLRINMDDKIVRGFLSGLPISIQKLERILGDLERIYGLFEKLYYITIRDRYALSIITGVSPDNVYLTRGLVERASWLAGLVVRGNSIIINGPQFTGRRTHLYTLGLILLERYGLPIVYPLDTVKSRVRVPSIIIDAGIQQILQRRDSLFMATGLGIDPVILEEFLKDKLIVATERDIGRDLGVRDKVVLFQTSGPQLYGEGEVREITSGLGLPRAETLLDLHIKQVLERTGLREEYSSLEALLRRIIPRLYFTGRYRELMGILSAVKNPCGVTTRSIVDVIGKAAGPEGRLGEVLNRLVSGVYALPHPSWRGILEEIIAEQEQRGLFKPFMDIVNNMSEFKSSIAIRTENPYEALAELLCIDELIVPLCRKGFVEALIVSPIHYLDESISIEASGVRNKIVSKGIGDRDLELIVGEYVKANQYIEETGLDLDKLFSTINNVVANPASLDPIGELGKVRQYRNTMLHRYFFKNTFPTRYSYDAISSVIESSVDELLRIYSPLKIGILAKNPSYFIGLPELRDHPVKCYVSGDFNCLGGRRSLEHSFYRAYGYYKLGKLKRANIELYRILVHLENRVKRMKASYLPLYLKTLELIVWSHYLMGEHGEAGKILDEMLQAYWSLKELLPPRMIKRYERRLALLGAVLGEAGAGGDDPWSILGEMIRLMAEDKRDEVIEKYRVIAGRFDRITPYNAKVYIDALIIALKAGAIEDPSEIIEKLSGSDHPYINFQLLRFLSQYIESMNTRRKQVPENILETVKKAITQAGVFGEWVKLMGAVVYRRMGINLLRAKPSRARELLGESLRMLGEAKHIIRDAIEEQLNATRLWHEIAKIMMRDYTTCYDELKRITRYYVKGRYGLLSRYWAAVCQYNNGLYRQAYESVTELFLMDRKNKYRRTIYAVLAYKIASRLGLATKAQFIDMIVDNISSLPAEAFDANLLRKVSRLITYLLLNGEVSAAKRVGTALLSRITRETELIGRLVSRPMLVRSLSNILVGMREMIDVSLVREFLEVIKKVEIAGPQMIKSLLYIMLTTNMVPSAWEFYKKHRKKLDKNEARIIEAILHYKEGNMKKAYKLAQKTKRPLADAYLNQWYYYIRSLYEEERGDRASASIDLLKVIGDRQKHLDKEELAAAYTRLARYNIDNNKYDEAYRLLIEALNIYEKLVFVYKKLNHLEQLSTLTRLMLRIAREATSYTLIGRAEKDLCSRINRYRKRLLPRIYRQYFSEQHTYCSKL